MTSMQGETQHTVPQACRLYACVVRVQCLVGGQLYYFVLFGNEIHVCYRARSSAFSPFLFASAASSASLCFGVALCSTSL